MPKTHRNIASIALAVAALGVELAGASAPVDFRIIPAGEFRAVDGRPTECAAWICDAADGARIVAELNARQSKRVIDYEHATLHAKKTGQKAEAAGWFQTAEWRDDGVWLLGVDWTALAAQEIVDTKYRYVSPVFSYDKKTGHVQALYHAALTNDPGIDGLTDLAALAADYFLNPTEMSMNKELLEQLCWLLNLPVGSTPEDVTTHLSKLIQQLRATEPAAASFDLLGVLDQNKTQIATLTAKIETPDPAKFVPIAALSSVQTELANSKTELATLVSQVEGGKLDQIVTEALSAGKLTPATEAWARDLGKKDIAALTAFLEAAPVVVTPGTTQTLGVKPGGTGVNQDDGNAIAEAALAFQIEQQGKGITISTVQAVAHVTAKK